MCTLVTAQSYFDVIVAWCVRQCAPGFNGLCMSRDSWCSRYMGPLDSTGVELLSRLVGMLGHVLWLWVHLQPACLLACCCMHVAACRAVQWCHVYLNYCNKDSGREAKYIKRVHVCACTKCTYTYMCTVIMLWYSTNMLMQAIILPVAMSSVVSTLQLSINNVMFRQTLVGKWGLIL